MKFSRTFKFVALQICYIAALCLLPMCVFAENGWMYPAEHLSSSRSLCITQDKYGYIWIGTEDGLNRFDGYHFIHYKYESGNERSLSSFDVNALHTSKNGELWIGTGKGICRFDYRHNDFIRYKFPTKQQPRVSSFLETSDGNLIFGTDGFGAFRLKGNQLVSYIQPRPRKGDGFYSRMFEDDEGTLWHSGYTSELIAIRKGKGKWNFKNYPCDKGFAHVFCKMDSRGFLAICTNGIVRYDYSTGKLSDAGYDLSALKGAMIEKAFKSCRNYIFLGTRGKGVFYIKRGERKAIPIKVNGSQIVENGTVNAFAEDNHHNIWMSCYRTGIYELTHHTEVFRFWNMETSVNPSGCLLSGIAPDGQGGILAICNRGGINHFSPDGTIKAHYNTPGCITSILRDEKGNIWISGNKHLWLFNLATKTCTEKISDGEADICHIASDGKGNLYYAVAGYGLGVYNIASGKRSLYAPGPNNSPKGFLNNGWIQHVMVDSKGMVWVSSADGVNCLDPRTQNFLSQGWNGLLRGKCCYCTIEDGRGNIVIGTPQGLYLYKRKERKLGLFHGSKELSSLQIYSMALDNKNDLWISTSKGIWHYNYSKKQFISYVNDNGQNQRKYIQDASVRLGDGRLVFGTDQGMIAFCPVKAQHNPTALGNIFVSAFHVDGKPQDNFCDKFEIPSGSNSFTFDFSLMNYYNMENVIYQYRIDGGRWVSSEEGNNTFTFNRVRAGSYKMELRAKLNGVYTPVKTIYLEVLAPWYASKWAYLFYLMLFLALAYWGYTWYRHRLKSHYEEQKMKFLINATHDIRSPLTLIMGPLKKLRNTVTDDDSKRYVDIIGRNADRMLTLVNQILDIRKLDKEQMKIHCRKVDMVAMINGITALFQFNAKERGITIVQKHNKESIYAYVDRYNFEKVITNLLSNAMKYSFDGGSIEISIEEEEKQILIMVADDGIGYNKEEESRLFDRFYQGKNSRGYNIGGTGIGLNLCKQLVQMHGGEIKAIQRPDGKRGACFMITLPAGKEHLNADQLDEELKASKENGTMKASKNYRLLVADDDVEVARYIKMELSQWYKSDIVTNGKDALNALLNDKYDLLISDVIMPEMDGITLLKNIKGNPNISDVPVILLTSKAEVDDRLQGLKCGADAFIAKPFSINELHITIDNLVDNVRRLKGKFSGNQSQKDKVENVTMKSDDSLLMEKVMKSVNENYTDSSYNVERMAEDVGLSRVQLHRRLKEITGVPASDFIRNIRLEQAARIIKEKKVNVSQVAYSVGFNSHAHFSTLFKKYYGVSPSEYADKEHITDK